MSADNLHSGKQEIDTGEKKAKAFPLVRGKAFFIAAIALLTALFTGGIVYGVQSLVWGGEPAEGQLVDGVVEFNITERQWSFDPPVIRVNPGDRIRFNVSSQDMMHGFTIIELGVNLGVSPNKTATREVVIPADFKTGVYSVFCSVFCGIGHPYMKGRIIVGNPNLFLGGGLGRILPFTASLFVLGLFAAGSYWWMRRKTMEKRLSSFDLMEIGFIRKLVRFHALQFVAIVPVLGVFAVASMSILFGVKMAASNFGMVLTWVVWWGLMIGMFIVVGRGWCFVCPFGSIGEWLQRTSLWWKTKWNLGFDFKYPRRMQNLWLAVIFFVVFLFLDAGYGISNNIVHTSGLILVLILLAVWIGVLFERRTFCRYHCPLTVFIGMSSMFAPIEIRRKDENVCRQCETKDCYKGNDRYYGCPTFQFQGAGLDSNRDCTLCTECIKACPSENIGMRFRMWGYDLWARKKGRPDEAVAAVIITSLVTVVSLLLVLLHPRLYFFLRSVLPGGIPPNDWPRLASIAVIYLGGIGLALLLMYGFSNLSRYFSGSKDVSAGTFFTHFAYALIPLGVMKFFSDILDHVFRTWVELVNATRGLMQDFPMNRVMVPEAGMQQFLSNEQIYLLQAALISIGFGFSLYVAFKLADRMFPERATAFRAFLPVGAFIFVLTMAALWALSAAL